VSPLSPDSFMAWFPVVVRYTGVGIALWETLGENLDRPSLLVLAAGMMGLPEVLSGLGLWQKPHSKNGRRKP
jgi:hypothetical protein